MDDASNNIIGVTKRGTIWCSLYNVGATLPFKGGGSLLEVRAGVVPLHAHHYLLESTDYVRIQYPAPHRVLG